MSLGPLVLGPLSDPLRVEPSSTCRSVAENRSEDGSPDSAFIARRLLAAARRVASRRACYNVPLRLAVRERLQEAGSSNVLPHGQHRVSALVPTPHHHFPYRVLRTFVHSYPGLADESHHVVPESRFPLPPSLSRALFLSFCLSPSCSFSLSGASPAILLARVTDKRHRVHDSLTDDTCVTFHTKICIVNYKRLSEVCIFYARVAHIILINPFRRFKCFMIRI